MIELIKRVLSTGFVVLEYRQREHGGDLPEKIDPFTEWETVPYVDEEGNPYNGVPEHTG